MDSGVGRVFMVAGAGFAQDIPLQGGFEVMHRTRNRPYLYLDFINLHYRIPNAKTRQNDDCAYASSYH